MGGTKGYRSYRGRTSKGKIALAVVLVLIILAAVGFLWLQEYIVYDADGNARLDLPWRQEASVPPAEEEDPLQNVEITVQEPEAPAELAAFSAGAAPLTRADWQETWMGATMMSAPAWNAAAVTLKDSAGHICFAAAGAAAGTVSTAEDTAAALAEVTESRYHTMPG